MKKFFTSAFDAANKVLACTSRGKDGFIELQDIIDTVENISGYQIGLNIKSFKTLNCGDSTSMMSIEQNNNRYLAKILINADKAPKLQRFAVAHELGHILTDCITLDYITPNDGNFVISTKLNPDITLIDCRKCLEDNFLYAEQLANIFAVLVLIPDIMNIKTLSSTDMDNLLSRYGVSCETIYSKLILDSIWQT